MTETTITALRAAAESHGDSATGDLLREAADALEQFQWRPIDDNAPMECIVCASGIVGEAHRNNDGQWYWANVDAGDYCANQIYPTHYMPLPPPPKRGEP